MLLRDLDILSVDYTAAKESYRRTEIHNVSDLNGYFLIPFEGPMYVRNLVVRADGAILTIEKDYTIEDDFVQLELMTGKKVIGSLRIKDHIVKDYKEIKIAYQKVGEFTVSRAFLLNSAEVILHNPKPIDWLTQVFGKPETYPPAFHTHDISSSDEMVGFSDLLLLFKQASGQTRLHGLDLWKKLKSIETVAYKRLGNNYEALWNKMFTHVMNVNVPHRMTKADIELGDHPNYGTATLVEDTDASYYTYNQTDTNGQLILKTDKISTPKGVHAAIDNYDTDTDGYVRQGSLPFSYYGSGFYLPPPIKGSFEGLGSDLGTAAICLESNGVVTALIRGYDSKVKSLYYYYNNDIYNNAGAFTFSGVKYSHPLIEADNAKLKQTYADQHGGSTDGYIPLEANHVVAGSSGLILCIGDREKNQYYIGLGNNTLDSNSHVLKRINVNDFNHPTEGNVFDPFHSCIMLIGDYVYFVAQTGRWPSTTPESAKYGLKNPSYRMRIFYRALKSDLTEPNSDDIVFTKQLMNYHDLEGNYYEQQTTVDFAPAVIGKTADGKEYCKSMWVDYTQPPDPDFVNILLSPYHCQWVFKEDPINKNVASIKFMHGIQHWYYGVRSIGENLHMCVPMTFNANTNTITIDERWFKIGYDIRTSAKTIPSGKNPNSWYSTYISGFVGNYDEVNAVWVERVGICAIGTRTHGLPFNSWFYMGNNKASRGNIDQWDEFNLDFSAGVGFQHQNISMESPFGFASVPGLMQEVWYYNGALQSTPIEVFRSLDNNAGLDIYYRISDDTDYVEHADLKFPYINKTVYARSPNSRFGQVRVGDGKSAAQAALIPSVNYPVKKAKSSQYGMFRLTSRYTSGGYPIAYSDLYAIQVGGMVSGIAMDSNGGFYLDTLGKHTLDEANKQLTVESDLSGRIWITRDFWRGLISKLMGDKDSLVTSQGLENGGEYLLAVFLAHPVDGTNIPVSFAQLVYHQISADGNIAKQNYMRAVMFDWSSAGNNSEGYRIAKLGNVKDITTSGQNTLYSENFNRTSAGRWGGGADMDYRYPTVRPSVQIAGTDRNNMDIWFSSGIQVSAVGGALTPNFRYTVKNGVESFTGLWDGLYVLSATNKTYQSVYGGGIQRTVTGGQSGGAGFYTDRGDGTYSLIEAVFVKGNWTLFISTSLTVVFNGSSKKLNARNYALDQLGIDPSNRVFYLYAVCGKTEGYYDLSLSERTASPYHILVATITTISTGIKTIEIDQVFAVSGFAINTSNRGGSVPATTGTFPEYGAFDAISSKDLFDTSNY